MATNRWIGIGRLARDPELSYTPSGAAVARFTVAVDRDYTDKTTGKRETDWIKVTCWRKLAEIVSQQLTKGRLVAVEGSIRTDSYTDKTSGDKRSSTGVVADAVRFLDWPKDGQERGHSSGQGAQRSVGSDNMDEMDEMYNDCTLDDMPF